MTLQLKPGSRIRSAVCDTEVIVVRAPKEDLDVRCGGQPMVALGQEPPVGLTVDAQFDGGTLLGKRDADDGSELELLCTKAGKGALSIGDVVMEIKQAKALPSSD